MAESVDAGGLNPPDGNIMWVRVPLRAQLSSPEQAFGERCQWALEAFPRQRLGSTQVAARGDRSHVETGGFAPYELRLRVREPFCGELPLESFEGAGAVELDRQR